MPRKSKRPPEVLDLTATASEAPLLELVRAFLARMYTASRRAQTVLLSPDVLRPNSRSLDGWGGSALLTELVLRVLGARFTQQRELCKRLLLAAAWSLRMPVFALPTGGLTVGLVPLGGEPPTSRALRNLVEALPLPAGVLELVLAHAGELWVRAERQSALQLCRFTECYCLETEEVWARRLMRSLVPYECCALHFTDEAHVLAEWDPSMRALWLHAASLWPLVTLMRYRQRKRGSPSRVLTIRGFGEVLI